MSINYARISAAVAMTISSSAALADGFQKGFYIGLNTGASFVTGQTYDDLSRTGNVIVSGTPVTISNTTYRDEASARGYNGGILAGWSFYSDRAYIYSIEASGNLYSNRAHQTYWTLGDATNGIGYDVLNFEESWDLTYSADIVFKPGYFVSETTQLYAIMGASVAELKTQLKNLTSNTAFDNKLSFEDTKTLFGFVLGAGIQKQLCNHLSFFTSYQYTYYGHQNLSDGVAGELLLDRQAISGTFLTTADRSIRIDTNVFKVGFTYTF